jgi:hypothetical protein
MSYQLIECYCSRCRTATPHEINPETGKGECATCAEKQRRMKFQNEPEATAAFRAALDAYGPYEEPQRRKQK